MIPAIFGGTVCVPNLVELVSISTGRAIDCNNGTATIIVPRYNAPQIESIIHLDLSKIHHFEIIARSPANTMCFGREECLNLANTGCSEG